MRVYCGNDKIQAMRDFFTASSRCFVASSVLLAAACGSTSDSTPAPAATAPVTQRSGFEVAPGLPTLPREGIAVAPRPVETVRAVYEFAASHPEVLDYIPCFCGCESAGHKSNEHCFVGARNGNGQVTQWDYHGLT